jgi:hypothetical protein
MLQVRRYRSPPVTPLPRRGRERSSRS